LALAQGLLSDAELRAMGGAEGRGLLADALVGRLNREPNDTALDVQVSLKSRVAGRLLLDRRFRGMLRLLRLQKHHNLLLQSTLDVLLALAQGLLSDAELRAMGGAEGRGLLADALVGRLNREPNDTALDVQVSLELRGSRFFRLCGRGELLLESAHHILGALRQGFLSHAKLGAVIGAKQACLLSNAGRNCSIDFKFHVATVNV